MLASTLSGVDHSLFSGDPTETISEIGRFLAADASLPAPSERVLATVLFADVSELSDTFEPVREEVLGQFHELARREVGSRRSWP